MQTIIQPVIIINVYLHYEIANFKEENILQRHQFIFLFVIFWRRKKLWCWLGNASKILYALSSNFVEANFVIHSSEVNQLRWGWALSTAKDTCLYIIHRETQILWLRRRFFTIRPARLWKRLSTSTIKRNNHIRNIFNTLVYKLKLKLIVAL